LKRTLTSLLLIPPVIYLIGWSPDWLFLLAVAAGVVLGLREFFGLCRAMGIKIFAWAGYVGAVALCVARVLPASAGYRCVDSILALAILLLPTLGLLRRTELKDYLAASAATLFGILYVGFALSCLIAIRGVHPPPTVLGPAGRADDLLAPGPRAVLLLFLVIWAGDISAYLVGRSVGRTPFFARISPRKTREGALAGLVGSALTAWGFAHWFWKSGEVKIIIMIAVGIAVAGQVGDLVESAIKRGADQKDSGTLLPGHGGFLDRIDSTLFAAPALWLIFLSLGYCS